MNYSQISRRAYDNGAQGEMILLDLMRLAGCNAERANESDIHATDIIWSGLRVECKTALRRDVRSKRITTIGDNARLGFQFLLHRAGKSDHAPSDYTVLMCFEKLVHAANFLGAFVIPTSELKTRDTKAGLNLISISNSDPAKYRGRFAKYYNRAISQQSFAPRLF